MAIVIQHGVSPFVSGLAAFRGGRAQAERATRERDIQTSLALGRLGSRGLDRGFAEASRNLRQQQDQRDALEQLELGQEQRLQLQRDDVLQRSIQEQMLRDQKIGALQPHLKIQYLTRQQQMLNILTDPDIPNNEKEQMIPPMAKANQMLLQTVQPPPTFEERMERSTRLYEDLGIMLYEEEPGGKVKARAFNREKADQLPFDEWKDLKAEAIKDALDELEKQDKQNREKLDFLKLDQAPLGESAKRALARKIGTERFNAELQEYFSSLKGRRQAEGVPPAAGEVRKAKQQQQQQGQLAAQQRLRTRMQAQAPPPVPKAEQVLNRGAQELTAIVQQVEQAGGKPDQPETWSDFQLHNAKGAAVDFLQALEHLAPDMSLEQRMELHDLAVLARRIYRLPDPVESS